MASCENKYITLLDLSRQAKVITGETACFDGKIQVGIPFSGYPTGVDTGTTTSLGIISNGIAVFSGGTGTTIFDVSNPLSPNYSPLFSGSSGYVWSNDLFSGNTSGLTLPITPLSAETQVVGPVWAVSQTATTSNGEYIIDVQYTGYSITYSFQDLTTIPITAYTAYSGFCYTTQENFSAGTLDYKGPLDYISTKEDATVEGILTTKKLTVTDGASASTIGYVLTQLDSSGRAGWVFNSASASTNTFVTGGTLNGTNLDLTWNTGGSVPSIELSGLTFTGNTSGDCITDIHVSNIHSCSPLNINPNNEGSVYFGSTSAVTIDVTGGLSISNMTYTNKKIYTNLSTSGESSLNISGFSEDIANIKIYGDRSNYLDVGVIGSSFSGDLDFGVGGDAYIYSNEKNNELKIVTRRSEACPDSFTLVGENCVSTTASTTVSAETIVKAVTNFNYGKFGARFCVPNSYTTCGSGAPASNFFNTGNSDPFWGTLGGVDGRLNEVGVWVTEPPVIEDEWLGFSNCVTAATDGQYLIALAGDDTIRFSLDGELLVENPWDGNIVNGNNFNYWWVWPLDLTAGKHVINLEGYDNGSFAAFGCEIIGPYPPGTFTTNTDFNIFTGTTGKDSYTANTIFSSLDEIGNTFDTQSNLCPSGYTYDVCVDQCIKYESPSGINTEGNVGFYVSQSTTGGTPDLFIQGSGVTRGNVAIGHNTPTEKLDVLGNIKMVDGNESNGYVLTSDANGVGSWAASAGGGGGIVTGLTTTGTSGPSTLVSGTLNVPEYAGGGGTDVTTAATTTIDFSGLTYHYDSVTPATGNITENLTGAKLGLIQKIYHNDVSEPTYPLDWVLMGDAIYFTSTLNIIYAEWAGGSRVEYWYVQEQ